MPFLTGNIFRGRENTSEGAHCGRSFMSCLTHVGCRVTIGKICALRYWTCSSAFSHLLFPLFYGNLDHYCRILTTICLNLQTWDLRGDFTLSTSLSQVQWFPVSFKDLEEKRSNCVAFLCNVIEPIMILSYKHTIPSRSCVKSSNSCFLLALWKSYLVWLAGLAGLM